MAEKINNPENNGGRLFTQEEVNAIVCERLARDRSAAAEKGEAGEYKTKYEALKAEFDEYKSSSEKAAANEKKLAAYSALLSDLKVSDRISGRVAKLVDLDTLELNENGTLKDADRLKETVKSDWGDFIVTEKEKGATVENPPYTNTESALDEKIRNAFKPQT